MKLLKAFFILALLALIAWAFLFGRQTFIGTQQVGPSIRLEIVSGDDWQNVSDKLAVSNIIDSSTGYKIFALFSSTAKRIKPGIYDLQPGLSYRAIAQLLSIGPTRNEIQVTVIEGWTIDQETEMLAREQGVDPSAVVKLAGQSRNAASMDTDLKSQYVFLKNLPRDRSLEGYLFPDTYRVWKDQMPEGLIRKQLSEFEKRYGDVDVSTLPAPLKNLDEAVTLASIVEKEVKTDADRKMVAGIFLNRLKKNMPLQSDATLSYITGSKRAQANAADLELASAYNTYKNIGLPPSPIGNPSESAMQAVLEPNQTDYLYFLTDGDGRVYYARTLDEHISNRKAAGL